VGGRQHMLKATPNATSVPQVWLLGSSDYSARLAAHEGLPYVFAHHFAGQGTSEALALYRSNFVPSETLSEPRTFLTVNVSVADTDEEAQALARPQLLTMIALRTGQPLTAQPTVERAMSTPITDQQWPIANAMSGTWLIGARDDVRERLEKLAAEFEVDEVMINPIAGAHEGTDPRTAPAREETLRLLVG
jgi:luciferase family oxidoreductase group 1